MVPIAHYNGPAGFQPQDRAFNYQMPYNMPNAGGNMMMPSAISMQMGASNFSNAPIGNAPVFT